MLPVSTDYPGAIKKKRKRPIRTRLEITWTDPYIDQSIQVTTNGDARISWPKQTADAMETATHKWLSADGACKPNGAYHPCPDSEELARRYQMGYWSQKLSGAGGVFAAPYPRLTVRFLPRPVFGIKVIGDDKRNEWPVDFRVYIYDRTGELAHTEEIQDNQDLNYQQSLSVSNLYDVTRMELEIRKWSHPGRNAKIIEFFTAVSEIYEGHDIISTKLLEERETSEGSLPIGNITANEIDLRLLNLSDRFNPGNTLSAYHNLIRPNRRIRAWIGPVLPNGMVEYQPLGVFWTMDWQVPDRELYIDTTARDRMEMLKNITYYCEVHQSANLYDRAVAVFEDAKITYPDLLYWVDPELAEWVIPWFYLDPCNHREALRRIIEVAIGQAYADRKGTVRAEGPSYLKLPEEE